MSNGRVLLMSDYRRGSRTDAAPPPTPPPTPTPTPTLKRTPTPTPASAPAHTVLRSGPGPLAMAPSLAQSRERALILGANQEALEAVTRAAVAFTRWRLVQEVRGDFAFHATRWSLMSGPERSLVTPCANCPAGATSSAEAAAVRWATARLTFLLGAGLPVSLAVAEADAIPLEATQAGLMTRDQWEVRTRLGQWPPERDNVVADTVPVWALTAAEFRSQRLVARRILTLEGSGGTHDGWFAVPSAVAAESDWQVVGEAEAGRAPGA